jgi:hypothetical protein
MSRFDVAKSSVLAHDGVADLATYAVGRTQYWYIATAVDRRSSSSLTLSEVVYYDLLKATE